MLGIALLLPVTLSVMYTNGVFMNLFPNVDCGAVCNETIDGVTIEFINGFKPGDNVRCTTCTGLQMIQGGRYVLDGVGTVRQFASILGGVEFRAASNGTRTIRYNWGKVFYNSVNQHFYSRQYCSPACDWGEAIKRCALTSNDYFGLAGYLVTLTSPSENDFILDKNLSGLTGGTDNAVEGDWVWVTGPEGCPPYDTSLTTAARSGCDMGPIEKKRIGCNNTLYPQCGQGSLFRSGGVDILFGNWSSGEPNNVVAPCPQHGGSCFKTGEDYLSVNSKFNLGWSDFPFISNLNENYICEWGGVGSLNSSLSDIVMTQVIFSSCEEFILETACRTTDLCTWVGSCIPSTISPTAIPTVVPTLAPTLVPTLLPPTLVPTLAPSLVNTGSDIGSSSDGSSGVGTNTDSDVDINSGSDVDTNTTGSDVDTNTTGSDVDTSSGSNSGSSVDPTLVPTSVPTGHETFPSGFTNFKSSATGGVAIGTTAVAGIVGSSGGGAVTSTIVISLEMHCIREFPGTPLPFAIHPTRFSINDDYWSGCIIGNIGVCLVMYIILTIICRATAWKTGDLQSIEAKLRYPGILIPPMLILFPSILLYSGELLFRGEGEAVAVVVGITGVVFCIGLLAVIFFFFRTDDSLTYFAPISQEGLSHYSPAMIYIFGAGTWHNTYDDDYVSRRGPLYDVYLPVDIIRGHYTLIEFGSVVAIVTLSWIPDDNKGTCTMKISLMIVVLLVQTLITMAKNLFISKMLKHLSVLAGIASVAGLGFQLWSLHGYALNVSNLPGTLSEHCISASVTLTLIRSVFDMFSVCMDLSSGFKGNLRNDEKKKQLDRDIVTTSDMGSEENGHIHPLVGSVVFENCSKPLKGFDSCYRLPKHPSLLQSNPEPSVSSSCENSMNSSTRVQPSVAPPQTSVLQGINDDNLNRWGEHSVEYVLYNNYSL